LAGQSQSKSFRTAIWAKIEDEDENEDEEEKAVGQTQSNPVKPVFG
jgi:hypothetical protein